MQFHSGRHRASWRRRRRPGTRRARLAALISAAVAAIALPLAMASAGPVGDAGRMVARMSGLTDDTMRTADGGARDVGVRDAGVREGETRYDSSADGGGRHDSSAGGEGRQDGARDDRAHGAGGRVGGPHAGEARGEEAPAASRSPLSLGIGLATATRCGPDLSSPYGIEAQTCVLTRDEETWARTYYRNATGEKLSSALSLMAPDGRSVRMHCVVGAQDEPGVCETPRERIRGDLGAYTAVAEFAPSAWRGPLLLRSGSNSPQGQGG